MANTLPFNSIDHDRVYKAEDWAWYFATFLANGVFPKPSDGLQVIAYDGMEVRVNVGYAFINGTAFRNPVSTSIKLATAEGAQNRIDRIVVRWDLTVRDTYLAVLKGVPSAKPTATALTRNTERWELALADIYVGKGVTGIRTANITDQRFNSAVCGIVKGTVEEIDASVLTKQFNDFFEIYSNAVMDEFSVYKQAMENYLFTIEGVYNQYVAKTEALFTQYETEFTDRYSTFTNTLEEWEAELLKAYTAFVASITLFEGEAEADFNAWFESIKGRLGEDVAGALELEIEQLTAAVEALQGQVQEGTQDIAQSISDLDKRLTSVENGWGINYKHEAVLGLCYLGAAYMAEQHERTEETAILGVAYAGNSYLANNF